MPRLHDNPNCQCAALFERRDQIIRNAFINAEHWDAAREAMLEAGNSEISCRREKMGGSK